MTVAVADPGRGDPWGITAASRERTAKAAAARAAEASVRGAIGDASPAVWSGKARDAFVQTAGILADDLNRLAGRWDSEASALASYAAGVQEVKDQQAALTLRRESAEQDFGPAAEI